jgi:hypothetical protein
MVWSFCLCCAGRIVGSVGRSGERHSRSVDAPWVVEQWSWILADSFVNGRLESSACDLASLELITASIPQTAHWQWDSKDRKGEGERRCFKRFVIALLASC